MLSKVLAQVLTESFSLHSRSLPLQNLRLRKISIKKRADENLIRPQGYGLLFRVCYVFVML